MVKKSSIFLIFCISWSVTNASVVVNTEYWYKNFEDRGTAVIDGETLYQYWHIFSGAENPVAGYTKEEYTHVPAGTVFDNWYTFQVLVPKLVTNTWLFSSDTQRIKFSTSGVPIYNDRPVVPTVNVVIPTQPVPEDDIVQFPWAYGEQEPLTNEKIVESKNFNLDRYYLLEAKDSFDGVCNLILKINWDFNTQTYPVDTRVINNSNVEVQYSALNVNGTISIHDSYIQNQPIEDGQYIHEFNKFVVDTENITYSDSLLLNNGRMQYAYDQSINVKARYNSISVISGASVTTTRNFELNIPVYENFTFK